jgi:DNA-directed RNA polymerase specialized sigma subunit
MIRLDHEERKLIRLKEQYLDIHEEIRNRILLVRPDLYADVLYMRYLEGKSLVDIAEELLYSYIYVCKLHGRALLEFARKNPDIC